MNGIAVLTVLLVAKAAALLHVPPPPIAELPLVLADDVVVALVLVALAPWLPRVCMRILFAVLVAWTAANAALVVAIGRPLALPMLQGADEAMGDSMRHYLRIEILWPAVLVLAIGGVALLRVGSPGAVSHRRCRFAIALAAASLAAWWWLPPPASPAHRNALLELIRSAMPRSLPDAAPPLAPVTSAPSPLSPLRGAARSRSVVFVVLESAAPRFLRSYGADQDPMPFLTGLAADSLLATDAYCVYPESILGQLAILHAVAPAPDRRPEQYRELAVPSLAEALAPKGYRSALVHAGRFAFLGMEHVLAPGGFHHLADAATISGERESSFGIDEESAVAALLAWVDTLPANAPFVAAWLPIAGHHPYASPPGGPFPYDNELDCYRNALHWCDRNLRTLWQELCRRRPAAELLLCVIGDHGQAFGEHDGNVGHTFALYDENVRVPWLLHAPGLTSGLPRWTVPCCHLDVAPTVLDLLGVAADPGHQGRSLLQDAASRPVCFFTDWGDLQVGVRDGCWKLVHTVTTGRDQLFDLLADPAEQSDLAATDRERVERLRAIATAWLHGR
ncbi:MAG: sulfatase-like hydrolase/transferase [Planctomycetes bacterium]|nr:sulfatase-like hydrolase/transferase [Planctomycetota bacterium]